MKIVHIISSLDIGGAESMLFRLIISMPQHNHVVISLNGGGPIGKSLIASGYRVHEIGLKSSALWHAFPRLWRLIRREGPDIVQTWMYHSDFLGGVISRLAGARQIVWNVRNTEIPQDCLSMTSIFVRLCAITSSWLPRAIICCAQSALEFHVTQGYKRGKMLMIPNGYDIVKWKPISSNRGKIRRYYGFSEEAFIVGIMGRYDPLKGYDVFIEAAALISNSVENVVFVMIGRQVDENNSELSSLIRSSGGGAVFRLLGERSDVSQLMSTMDVYCLSSKSEGFPNVVAEAMLMQVPCVVTNVGDAAVIVGDTGYVVPPGDTSAIAEAVTVLANMGQEERWSLGKAARQRIINRYSIEAVSKRYEQLYEEISKK